MITIYTQQKFIAEKQYSFDVLFHHFLGLNYVVKFHDTPSYRLQLPNGNTIDLADEFWSHLPDNESYLSPQNIPNQISSFQIPNSSRDLIGIFQSSLPYATKDNHIFIPVDIFASSFFMLSRWEEYANKTRDKIGRFPDTLSLAQRFRFHKRPVVNEYLEFLWNQLQHAGCTQSRKRHTYTLKLTHDVDFGFRYDSLKKRLKALSGDLLKRHSFSQFKNTIHSIRNIKKGREKDPYDTFDFLMDTAEKQNLTAHFYFIAGQKNESDTQYNITDKNIKSVISNIIDRQHTIGIHGGWDSFENIDQLKTEKERLQNIIHKPITEGRQHFLRFSVPHTWQDWETLHLQADSSMGYSNTGGFRCGTCYPFPVFNILSRETLTLMEYPLIVMDTALQREAKTVDAFNQTMTDLARTVYAYGGTFTLLWHPNNFHTVEWSEFASHYSALINTISHLHD